MYEILERINSPADLKKLSKQEISKLCIEIREFLIEKVTKNGGHLASNLGVVELTVALHLVFDAPKDKIIWDVGHQTYVHKILTGRRDRFDTLRKFGGLSGFPKTNESEYDCFNTGHASTSVSAALGAARARDIKGENNSVCAVFGDGALTGGMIYEAINDVGHRNTPIVLVLNDNEMSISENVGALSRYLLKLRQSAGYHKSKRRAERIITHIPLIGEKVVKILIRIKDIIRAGVLRKTFFDDLGLDYLGPVDGHDIGAVVNVLRLAKNMNKPVIVHVITKKGKGYPPAEKDPEAFHGISPSGAKESGGKYKDYSECFGKKLISLAKEHDDIAAITAAMPNGVGLEEFGKIFPDRFFDVGIAEEHAVTLAAGLASSGITPVFSVYSSFLQRGFDQLLHDVCLQGLHAVFMIDRAGAVGADGETHHGLFDMAYLSLMPGIAILSPSSFSQLEQMTEYAVLRHQGPIAVRYPRGDASEETGRDFVFGKINVFGTGNDILITSGRMLRTALEVRKMAAERIKVIEMPTVIPFGEELKKEIKGANNIFVLEDHSARGGIGSMISEEAKRQKSRADVMCFSYPCEPVVHGSVCELDKKYGLDAESVYGKIKSVLED